MTTASSCTLDEPCRSWREAQRCQRPHTDKWIGRGAVIEIWGMEDLGGGGGGGGGGLAPARYQ